MATNTTNYNLTKPDPTDFYDIGVTNANLDKIDTAIKSEADKISALTTTVNNKTQIATTAEAQAGIDNSKIMTPLRVNEAINSVGFTNTVSIDSPDNTIKNGFYRFSHGTQIISGLPLGNYLLEVITYEGVSVQKFSLANANPNTHYIRTRNTGLNPVWSNVQKLFTHDGGILSGNLTMNKDVPVFRLQTPNNTKSYEIRLNASDVNDYGLDIYRNGTVVQRITSDLKTQFRDTDGTYFSAQDLKQSVSNGKSQVAAAITGKGVTTAADASFATLANNISAIPSGKRIASGQVTRVEDYLYIPIPFTPSSIQYRGTNSGNTIYDTGQYIKGGTLPGISQDYSYFVNGITGSQGAPRVSNNGDGYYTIAHDTIRNSGIATFSWIAYE